MFIRNVQKKDITIKRNVWGTDITSDGKLLGMDITIGRNVQGLTLQLEGMYRDRHYNWKECTGTDITSKFTVQLYRKPVC